MYKITKYEGLTALWRGLSPALIMSVPANVIYFVGYDYLRDYIKPMTQTAQSDYSPLVAGALARTVAVTIISPIELFRTRLQATANTNFKSKYTNIKSTRWITNNYLFIIRRFRRHRCHGDEGWCIFTLERANTNTLARCPLFCNILDGI